MNAIEASRQPATRAAPLERMDNSMFRARRRGESGVVDPSRTSRAGLAGAYPNRRRNRPELDFLESRQLPSTLFETNTNAPGIASLPQSILDSNPAAAADEIEFDIPASTAPNLNVPVP